MRVHLVHNPKAGDEEHSRNALLAVIRNSGYDVHYMDARSEWQEQVLGVPPSDLVAVAGGDGTVGKVARVLAGTNVPIAVLPFGTANNVSSMLGVAGVPIDELVAGWARPRRRRVDAGIAHGPWGSFRFLESLGVGALAESIAKVADGTAGHVDRLDAAEARIDAGLRLIEETIRHVPARALRLVLDGHELHGEFVLVEALNFGTAGPNLRLSSTSDPNDGLLDVVLVGEDERRPLADHLPLYRTDPSRASALPVRRCSHLQLCCEDQVVHIDDRVWSNPAREVRIEVEVDVEPGALVFLSST